MPAKKKAAKKTAKKSADVSRRAFVHSRSGTFRDLADPL